jgi:hypothetical protein
MEDEETKGLRPHVGQGHRLRGWERSPGGEAWGGGCGPGGEFELVAESRAPPRSIAARFADRYPLTSEARMVSR